jgi:hypothetical protein
LDYIEVTKTSFSTVIEPSKVLARMSEKILNDEPFMDSLINEKYDMVIVERIPYHALFAFALNPRFVVLKDGFASAPFYD